jgi:hypothetical protein
MFSVKYNQQDNEFIVSHKISEINELYATFTLKTLEQVRDLGELLTRYANIVEKGLKTYEK